MKNILSLIAIFIVWLFPTIMICYTNDPSYSPTYIASLFATLGIIVVDYWGMNHE